MLGVIVVGADAAVVPDWIRVSSEAVVVRLRPRVVHVIWPTVNVRPSDTAAEARTMTILLIGKAIHTPYLARHCRRKLVGSLPWGIPTVVVYR